VKAASGGLTSTAYCDNWESRRKTTAAVELSRERDLLRTVVKIFTLTSVFTMPKNV